MINFFILQIEDNLVFRAIRFYFTAAWTIIISPAMTFDERNLLLADITGEFCSRQLRFICTTRFGIAIFFLFIFGLSWYTYKRLTDFFFDLLTKAITLLFNG